MCSPGVKNPDPEVEAPRGDEQTAIVNGGGRKSCKQADNKHDPKDIMNLRRALSVTEVWSVSTALLWTQCSWWDHLELVGAISKKASASMKAGMSGHSFVDMRFSEGLASTLATSKIDARRIPNRFH